MIIKFNQSDISKRNRQEDIAAIKWGLFLMGLTATLTIAVPWIVALYL